MALPRFLDRASMPALLFGAVLALGVATVPQARASDVPFVPTPDAAVRQMLEMVDAKPDDVVYDLGSGDGRIVIAAVRDFDVQRAVGVDLDPKLVETSRRNAEAAGVSDRAAFIHGNIFEVDFSEATVVTMYLLNSVNLKLRPRLLDELRPGTRLVSHQFTMSDWEPDAMAEGASWRLYHWVVPAKVAGSWQWQNDGEDFRVHLDQRFQKVSGTMTAFGGEVPIGNVELDGDKIRFEAEASDGGRAVPVTFEGTVVDDVIDGRFTVAGTAGTVQARRAQ